MSASTEDIEILQLVKSGKKHCFSVLYQTYISLLYNYGKQIIKDEELIKDCIQDLFIELWINRKQLKNVNSLRAYLIKSLRYKLHHHIRNNLRRNQKNEYFVKNKFNIELSQEALIIDRQCNDELKKRIRNNVNLLTERQREVIFHIFYHDLTYEEVASILSVTKKTVYNLLHNAIKSLRTNMKKAV